MAMALGAELVKKSDVIKLIMIGDVDVCGIERARNILLAHAMLNECDWLLMVDSDTWVEPGSDLLRMIVEAPDDAALIGAGVRTRSPEANLNVYRWNADQRKHESYKPEGMVWQRYFQCDAIGGAVIAINLHRIGDVDFRTYYYEDGDSISEDLNFCKRLREKGEKIYCDPRIKTFHINKPTVLLYNPKDPLVTP
jgi:GT2 family glycosyltransferase